jgi:hypothetical protein
MTELDERRNGQLRQIIHKLPVSPTQSAYLHEPALSRRLVHSRNPIQMPVNHHDPVVPQVILEDVPVVHRRLLLQRVDLLKDKALPIRA